MGYLLPYAPKDKRGSVKKKIEQNDTQKGAQYTTGISIRKRRSQKHAQQVNHDDVSTCKVKFQKQPSDDRCSCQNTKCQEKLPGGRSIGRMVESRFPR